MRCVSLNPDPAHTKSMRTNCLLPVRVFAVDEFTAGYATDLPYTYGGTIDCRIEAAKMARDELPDLFALWRLLP